MINLVTSSIKECHVSTICTKHGIPKVSHLKYLKNSNQSDNFLELCRLSRHSSIVCYSEKCTKFGITTVLNVFLHNRRYWRFLRFRYSRLFLRVFFHAFMDWKVRKWHIFLGYYLQSIVAARVSSHCFIVFGIDKFGIPQNKNHTAETHISATAQ